MRKPKATASSRRTSVSRKLLASAALALGVAMPADAAFTITLNFDPGMTQTQKNVFIAAKTYWESVISGYSTPGSLNGITIDVSAPAIDGKGGILGAAGPDTVVVQGGITYSKTGSMIFDSADIDAGIADGSEIYVIRHEMGHVLGIGTLWEANGLYDPDAQTGDAIIPGDYTGANAAAAWRIEFNDNDSFVTTAPVEREGSGGTANSHWDEVNGGAARTGYVSRFTGYDFWQELMTGWANPPNFTSNVTLGSLVDMGYVIAGGPVASGGVYTVDKNYLISAGANNSGTMIWQTLSGTNSLRLTGLDSATWIGVMGVNTYTGGTVISAGTLIAGNASALGTGNVLINGGNLDVTNVDLAGIGSLTLQSGSITGEDGSITATSYTVSSGSISTVLAGTGALTKNDAGTVTLDAANTYAGGTTINAGTLVLANNLALGTGTVTLNAGSLLLRDVNVVLPSTFTMVAGTVAGTATSTLVADTYDVRSGAINVALAGIGTLDKTGAGSLTLGGDNSGFLGAINVNGGTVVAGTTTALGAGSVTVSGGTLDLGSLAATAGAFTLVSGNVVSTGGTLAAASYQLQSGTMAAGLAGNGALTKTGSGTATLAGDGAGYSGNIDVTGGTLVASAAYALGTSFVNYDGGTLALADPDAAARATIVVSGTGTLSLGGATTAKFGALAGSGTFDFAAMQAGSLELAGSNNATFSGGITGAGTVTKSGSGTQTFSGTNSYTGATYITGGTLAAGSATAFGAGDVVVSTGGTFDIGAFNIVLAGRTFSLAGGTLTGTGSLLATNFDLTSGTVGATLAGAGDVLKLGQGTLTLSAANTYAGGTEVREGTLVVNNTNALGTGGVRVSGGVLRIGTDMTLPSLRVDSGAVVGSSVITLSSDLDLRGGGMFNTVLTTGSLIKSGTDTAYVSGGNSFASGVQIGAGRLVALTSGALGSGLVTVASGAVLQAGDSTAFNSTWNGGEIALSGGELDLALTSTTSVSRRISGTGNIVQNGTGRVTLTNVGYTGTTTVNTGTLVFAENAPITGAYVSNGGGTLEFASSVVSDFSRDVSGDGTLAFSGTGTTRLHGASGFSGTVVAQAGKTLSLGSNSTETGVSLSASLLAIRAGATLRGSGAVAGTLVNAGTLSPGFSPGTITLGGDFVNTGTLVMEIVGGAHDRIDYAGRAFLGGTLNLVVSGSPAQGTVIPLLVDTDTTDGKSSIVGNFASSNAAANGILYNNGSGLSFQVGGTLATIPGANIDPHLFDFANAVTAYGAINPTVGATLNPIVIPVSQLNAALMKSAPTGLASGVALPIAEASNNIDELRRHLDSRRFERVSADSQEWSPYVFGTGGNSNLSGGSASPFFNYYTAGGAVGADRRVGSDLTVGVRVGYDHAQATFHESSGRLEQDRAGATFYVSNLIERRFYVDAGAFGGGSTYDTRRNTVLGRETGDTSGWDAGLFVDTGAIVSFNKILSFTPHAGFVYTHAEMGGFREAGDALALNVGATKQDSLAARIGGTVNAITTFIGDMPLRIGLDASYVRELLDTDIEIPGSFAGGPSFRTTAITSVSDRLEVGPTLDLEVARGQSITASYRFDYAFGNGNGNRIDVGYRVRF